MPLIFLRNKVLLRTGVRNEKCLDCVGKDGSE